jgi:hypothetical protein
MKVQSTGNISVVPTPRLPIHRSCGSLPAALWQQQQQQQQHQQQQQQQQQVLWAFQSPALPSSSCLQPFTGSWMWPCCCLQTAVCHRQQQQHHHQHHTQHQQEKRQQQQMVTQLQ